jgi:murein L,D-transpeptidase YcbB/YkuD
MVGRPLLAFALAFSASIVSERAAPAWGQAGAAKSKSARAISLDAGPSGDSAPDPLTPPEVNGPAPAAPGAPVAAQEARPAAEPDPIVGSEAERADLAALNAFYAEGAAQPVWTSREGLTPRARQAIEEVRKADDWGLKASAFDLPALAQEAASLEALADAEIKLARAVLKYARHARGGRAEPASISRLFDQKPTIYDPKTLLQAIAVAEAADAYLRALHPKHPQFERLRQAMLAARDANGEEPAPPGRTPRASTSGNLQRLIVNMERWRWLPENLGPIYVWDSIPEQMTSVYQDGQRVLHEKIVVGKPSSPTPIFSADMQFIIFHPSWGVPPGMKMYELAPALRAAGGGWFFSSGASSVLAAHGLRVSRGGQPVNPDWIDWSSVDIRSYDFTQPPGPANVLGIVKFRFPNRHDVYMHDTPERHLFGGAVRAFSHGCMRVQNPVRLAEVLLAHDKGWSAEQVKEYVRRGGEIKLTNPIPVHITYFTAVVDHDGKVRHYPDIYALDSKVASRLEGQAINVLSAAADKPDAAPAAGGDSRRVSSRASRQKPKAAQSQFSNPFAAIFGN